MLSQFTKGKPSETKTRKLSVKGILLAELRRLALCFGFLKSDTRSIKSVGYSGPCLSTSTGQFIIEGIAPMMIF